MAPLLLSLPTSENAAASIAMDRKVTVVRTVDENGREVFTYVKNARDREKKTDRRKARNEAIRITLKLPR